MQGAKRLSLLVCTLVCLRARFFRTAWLENAFVDNVARVHGGSVSGQRSPLQSHSLPLHGAVFHPWSYCLPRVRSWLSSACIVPLDINLCLSNYLPDLSHF